MSKTKEMADDILSRFAGTQDHDKMRAVRTFCNSDSAFVVWAKKTEYSVEALRDARLIQQTWKRFGAARSILITLRAVKAALLKLMRGIFGRLKVAEALSLLQSLSGKSKTSTSPVVGGLGGPLSQQELFA
jgi:hypothetical protein